jgi:PPP family 3-phenylpropionic acid transporter
MAQTDSTACLYDPQVRRLQVLYLALGSSTAILNPFIAVILAAHGLGSEIIGVVVAFGAAGLFAAGPIWGHLGDYVIGRRGALLATTVIACATALAIAGPFPNYVLAVLMPLFMLSQGSSLGLCDSLAVGAVADPHRDYGRIRMMASISFAVVSIAVGFAYDVSGYELASLLYVASAIVIAATLVFVPDHRPLGQTYPAHAASGHDAISSVGSPAIRRGPRFGSTGLAFHLQPRLPGILAATFLVWFAVNISFTFLSLRIVDLGGGASDVAMSFGVSALFEVPGMLLAARVAARLGLRGLFAVGALGYAAAFLSWTVLGTPAAIVASRSLTGLSYGGLTVAMVLTMGEVLPNGLQATGQTLYQATATGLGSIAGNTVGGLLYGSAGAPFLFGLCAAIGAAGALLGLFTLPARVRRVALPAEIEEVVVPNSPVV